jgi:hypothetical protein
MATHVVHMLQAQLPAGAPALTRAHVWLMTAPPGVDDGVWMVVCLAALEVIAAASRRMWRPRPPQGQPPPDPPPPLDAMQRWAVARFWDALQDFVALPAGHPRDALRQEAAQLAVDHPFLAYAPAQRRLRVLRVV